MLANPETKTIHPNPGEQCNLDDARADAGPKPYPIKLREALNLMLMTEGWTFCAHCTDEAAAVSDTIQVDSETITVTAVE